MFTHVIERRIGSDDSNHMNSTAILGKPLYQP
jgi:hypothetical protein